MVKVKIYYEKWREDNKPFIFYLGDCKPGDHPLQNQSYYVSQNLGGTVPTKVMECFSQLKKFSQDYKVPFEELCLYAFGNETNKSVSAESILKIRQHQQQLISIELFGELIN